MTTLVAKEKDEEQGADPGLPHTRLANERGDPAACAEPIEHGPDADSYTAHVATGRWGRQIDYL